MILGLWIRYIPRKKNLHALISIKAQRYHTLMEVYIAKELDKLNDWIEKISADNKVIQGLHEDIQRLRDQTQEEILEAEKYCNTAYLDIFEDESKTKLNLVQSVV